MSVRAHPFRVSALSALIAAVALCIVPIMITILAALVIPGIADNTNPLIVFSPFLAGGMPGGAGWGYYLSRFGSTSRRKWPMMIAGAVYGFGLFFAAMLLTKIEASLSSIRQLYSADVHTIFLAAFVPAVFLVTALTGIGLGLAGHRVRQAVRMAGISGIGAAGAFLLVDLCMYLAGWKVGNPDFSTRPTMVTVTLLGLLAAASVGGAASGYLLRRPRSIYPASSE